MLIYQSKILLNPLQIDFLNNLLMSNNQSDKHLNFILLFSTIYHVLYFYNSFILFFAFLIECAKNALKQCSEKGDINTNNLILLLYSFD